MNIYINSNTITWHLCWATIDLFITGILGLAWYYHHLRGPWMFHTFVIVFMMYRTFYHGVSAWRLRP